jgi:malonate decarboxylase gamma subunit
LEKLRKLAKSTPIFAPGVEPLFAIGAVSEAWDAEPFAPRLAALLRQPSANSDLRDRLGLERTGRLLAHDIAERIAAEARAHV